MSLATVLAAISFLQCLISNKKTLKVLDFGIGGFDCAVKQKENDFIWWAEWTGLKRGKDGNKLGIGRGKETWWRSTITASFFFFLGVACSWAYIDPRWQRQYCLKISNLTVMWKDLPFEIPEPINFECNSTCISNIFTHLISGSFQLMLKN